MEIVDITEVRTPETVVAEIKATYTQVENVAMLGFVSIGKNLKELKDLVPHGEWLGYIEKNLSWSERKVQQFMQLADRFGNENSPLSNPQTFADLGFSNALKLLALPDEDIEQIAEEHDDIGSVSTKDLEAAIKEYKARNENLVEQLEKTTHEKEELERSGASPEDLSKAEEKIQKLKDKLARAEEDKKNAVNDAEEKARKKAQEEARKDLQAEITAAEKARAEAVAKAATAERKAENGKKNHLVAFKIHTDNLQDDFAFAITCIEESIEAEEKEKMKTALKKVLELCENRLEV